MEAEDKNGDEASTQYLKKKNRKKKGHCGMKSKTKP
jgi:hypothetical protein